MHLPDKELAAKAKAGDAEAFATLFKKYNGKILGYLYRYIGNYQTAEDLTVQTFMNAYNKLHLYRERGMFLSWLYKIATNIAKRELQNKRYRAEVPLEKPVSEDGQMSLQGIIADERNRPDYAAREAEFKEFIYRVLSKLDKKYKDVLLLCDVEGLSYDEAAKTLNVTPTAVGTRLGRARDMFYEILEKYGYKF